MVPAITVITEAQDAASEIGQAIASVRAQDRGAWELLVLDAGSRDRTAAAALGAAQGDGRIRLLHLPRAGAEARARALAAARGEALFFLDPRDRLAPNALRRLAACLAGMGEAVAAQGAFAVHDRASGMPQCLVAGPFPEGDVVGPLVASPRAAESPLLIRRAAIAAAGPRRPELGPGAEWEWRVRLALLGPVVAAPGRTPLLVRQARLDAASPDPAALHPALEAIHGNPTVLARLGRAEAAARRRQAEAEAAWRAGQDRLGRGDRRAGLDLMEQSIRRMPDLGRATRLGLARMFGGRAAAWAAR